MHNSCDQFCFLQLLKLFVEETEQCAFKVQAKFRHLFACAQMPRNRGLGITKLRVFVIRRAKTENEITLWSKSSGRGEFLLGINRKSATSSCMGAQFCQKLLDLKAKINIESRHMRVTFVFCPFLFKWPKFPACLQAIVKDIKSFWVAMWKSRSKVSLHAAGHSCRPQEWNSYFPHNLIRIGNLQCFCCSPDASSSSWGIDHLHSDVQSGDISEQ